jgi:hypothetical protein
MKTYYDVLDLAPYATRDEIVDSYHKLAQMYHPDKNMSPQSSKIFVDITEAYKTLSDNRLREYYDIEIGIEKRENGREQHKLSKYHEAYCINCYTLLSLSLAHRRGDAQIECPICKSRFSIDNAVKLIENLYKSESGLCPNCYIGVKFPIEVRVNQLRKIKCPSCSDSFYLSESLPIDNAARIYQGPKKYTLTDMLASSVLIVILFSVISIVFLVISSL